MFFETVKEVTEDEALCVLSAFEKSKKNNLNLCCHAHERDFLSKNDWTLTWTYITYDKSRSLLHNLSEKLSLLAEKNASVKALRPEWIEVTKRKSCNHELLFVASLLIDFHDNNECSKYMSLALKFYLDAYHVLFYSEVNHSRIASFSTPPATVRKILMCYLRYIVLNKFEMRLFVEFAKTFLDYHENLKPRSLEEDYRIYRDICELAHDLNFDFLSLLKNGSHPSVKDFAHFSILEDLRRYVVLTNFGFEDQYYDRAVENNVWKIPDYRLLWRENENMAVEENLETYRSFQLFNLYLRFHDSTEEVDSSDEDDSSEEHDSKLEEEVIRLVWKTIPDPYLTKEQFLHCVRFLESYDYQPKMHKAWEWYVQNVQIEDNIELTPRSLMHLSRCQVRKLANPCTKQLCNLKYSEVPASLMSYLCLEN